ncbi:hypothetical protein [Pseudoalteromonas mariniglutinosa]|uniref:hypothetical protein n=1 Tax=Pseudoalteromonas mariniglutinosa TaxID=206042 RepID=UPI00384D805F
MDVNTHCKIVNNSGKSVVTLDAFSETETTPPKLGYGQTLKVLATGSTNNIIENAANATVTLDDTREGGKANYLYQLLLSDPKSLFPISDLSVMLDFSSYTYPDQTVTETAANNMQKALTFQQSIMAYPTSNLAKGFTQALQSAQGKDSTSDIFTTMANFFNSTNNFKGLDYQSYVAVSTYLSAFAAYWGQSDAGECGRTYYVMKANEAKPDKGTKCVSCAGKINFVKTNNNAVADPTDPLNGYSVSYEPSSGSNVELIFSNGQLIDKSNPDTPSVAVQGTFAVKSQFTGDAADTSPWPVFVGTIDGSQVIASSSKPASGLWKFICCTTFNSLFNDFMKIMGLWMAIDFLKQKLSSKKNKLEDDEANKNKGDKPTEEQIQEANQDANNIGNEAQQQQQELNERIGGESSNVPDANDIAAQQNSIKNEVVETQNSLAGDNYNAVIEEYQGQIQELAKIGVDPALEDATSSLLEAKGNLSDAVKSGNFDDIKNSLIDVKTNINTAVDNLNPSEEVLDQIKESNAAIEDFNEKAESAEESAKSAEDGEGEFEPEELAV